MRGGGRTTRLIAVAPDYVLLCPTCLDMLTFELSIEGGVEPVEHWDQFVCRRCRQQWEYRTRTRKLRKLSR